MLRIFREISEIVFFRYNSESCYKFYVILLTKILIMAASDSSPATTSSSHNFEEAIKYALKQLKSDYLPKEEQLLSIRAIYERKNVFVWLPTGFGKSFCYQALPFVMDHKLGLIGTSKSSSVLVVSPLIALMIDQVKSLRCREVQSSIITSGRNLAKPFMATESSMCTDSLLFCTPEALVSRKWREILDVPAVSDRIVAIVVDEAHCVSKW